MLAQSSMQAGHTSAGAARRQLCARGPPSTRSSSSSGSSSRCRPLLSASSTRLPPTGRRASVRAAAGRGSGGDASPSPSSPAPPPSSTAASTSTSTSGAAAAADEEEARIEALEASTRKAKGKAATARRQIPIRNVTPRPSSNEIGGNMSEWKAGSLFPEGWEEMPLGQKLAELYLGRRGMIFWANKLAWGAVIGLGGAWVLFRVGGALGLYKLQGDLTMPLS